MVIRTERSAEEERLVVAFRGVFDASVMNFGAYNLLYAGNLLGAGSQRETPAEALQGGGELSAQENASAARSLLIGYRREPVEMVLCPVDPALVLPPGDDETAPAAQFPVLVNLTNLAGMATEGSTVEIALSTGKRVMLDIQEEITFEEWPETALHQSLDVEDFYGFLDHFMDMVEHKRS